MFHQIKNEMDNFLNFYQHLPLHFGPVAFATKLFSISWYAVMYLVAFVAVYFLLKLRIKRGEYNYEIKNQKSKIKIANKNSKCFDNLLLDLLFYTFIGLIIGARLGHVLFYNPTYYLQNPLEIISPFDPLTHEFIGIYGMSYHGGLIGAVIFAFLYCQKNKISFWGMSDFLIPAVPAGYFFGRIGNFINNELYGKATEKFWGMYFKDDPLVLRHPTQLYEAFGEGFILFCIFWRLRNRPKLKGIFLPLYLIGYALIRFGVEFLREPENLGFSLGFLTEGQVFSLAMIFLGMGIIFCISSLTYCTL